jgi:tetratricopeptide (TPR) repeat protein
MSMYRRAAYLLLLSSTFLSAALVNAQTDTPASDIAHDIRHQDPQWLNVQQHLPDPAVATPQNLELAGDILRARRFPEDALDYYIYALKRGGQEAPLMNKLGVTELELRNSIAARAYFERVVHLKPKDAQAWNNLGAVEYLNGRYGNAISDYKHAIKSNSKSATFHSNLGIAYFEEKNFKGARQQFSLALQLDPDMSAHDGATGVVARMLSPADHARYCFEMARLYAQHGDEENLFHYLTMASEAGFDILGEMRFDAVLAPYRKDPRVVLLVRNAQALRSGPNSIAEAKDGPPPPLPVGRE